MKALYVTDGGAIGDEKFHAVLRALAGSPGLTVQLRERSRSDGAVLREARLARDTLGPSVPLFVNRRFDIALAAGARGVHLPSSGLPLEAVRRHTPRGFAIGVSVHSAAAACQAIADGAALVVLGPIFDTPSKRAFGAPLGPEVLARLPPLAEHRSEVYVIGGIDAAKIPTLAAHRDRITGVAGIRLFQDAVEPRASVEKVVGAA